MRILVAEDDQNIREGLISVLQREGYDPVGARDGREAVCLFDSLTPDFVCLDIMMPGLDGYEVCRQIRRKSPHVPVIFISAKSEEIDRVLGLELGADDFIVKPFGVREVVARIRAVTRRYLAAKAGAAHCEMETEPFRMDDLDIFPAELRARRANAAIDLSLRETKMLRLLYHNGGKVVTRDMFFDACWGRDYMPDSRTLDQHVAQLRKKIERDSKNPRIIATVHGAGYRYQPD
ncbi:MAG TPA: response regulator transcription factor [Candidatus Bathyarchaeia archaeon]|nr:response regulator transcription factor [Candidatus Bathyarchaeia archaeon]